MSDNGKIYITGQSVVSSFVSVGLTQSNVVHSLDYAETAIDALSPTSNQLINSGSRHLEFPFILDKFKQNIIEFTKAEVVFYDQHLNCTAQISSHYPTSIYAIDNRIRIQSFDEKIKQNIRAGLVEVRTVKDSTNFDIEIVGGSSYKDKFDEIVVNPIAESHKKFISINLKVDFSLLSLFDGTRSFMFDGIGEIICYPFLHISNQNGVCVVINIIDGGIFDIFDNVEDSMTVVKKIDEILGRKIELLGRLFHNSTAFEKQVAVIPVVDYFRKPVQSDGQKLLVGVGSAILNTDPIVGQGYNLSMKLASYAVDLITNRTTDKTIFLNRFNEYSVQKLVQLYNLNRLFSHKENSNPALGLFFFEMINNPKLSAFWFRGIDDISNYFPWIEDEQETKKIIQNHQ